MLFACSLAFFLPSSWSACSRVSGGHCPSDCNFFKLSSYGDEKESSGHIKVLNPLSADIKGRHVVVVEDIVDSGLSVQFLLKMLSAFEPATLRVATLLRKKSRMKILLTSH